MKEKAFEMFIWFPTIFRLRASMEGFLGTFNPKTSVSPAGIFSNRVEVRDECIDRSELSQGKKAFVFRKTGNRTINKLSVPDLI